jgi:hypothetical protein
MVQVLGAGSPRAKTTHPIAHQIACVMEESMVAPASKDEVNLIYKVTCCVRASVRDHWTQRKVTVDAEESDGKKKSGGGRREKIRRP